MRKIILTAVAIFGIAFAANAQDLDFGVKAGFNFTNVDINTADAIGDADSADGQTSLYIGGFVDISFSEKFSIQPEVLFSGEGAEDIGMAFINVPIMLKYYVVEGLSLQAGPQIGFLVAAEDDGDEVLKSTNFGFNAGIGYELANMGLFFDARYNFGLSDISDVEGAEIKTKGFQIGVGYKF